MSTSIRGEEIPFAPFWFSDFQESILILFYGQLWTIQFLPQACCLIICPSWRQGGSGGLKVREASVWLQGHQFNPWTGRINLGGGKWNSSVCPSLITTTEVPLSKALNLNCSSGAAQWPAKQTVFVLGSLQVWMCNCMTVIRVFLKKRALLSEKIPSIDKG